MIARFLKILLLILVFVPGASATITLVQHKSQTQSLISNPSSLAFTSTTTAGNTVLAWCGQFDNGGGSIPVIFAGTGSPPLANFTEIETISDSSTFRSSLAVFANIPGGSMTVTCDNSNGSYFTLIIAEYSGVDPYYPVDVFNQAYSASGSTKNAGAITTTQANEVIAAFYYDDHIPGSNFSATIGSGFTIEEQAATFGSNTQGGFADKVVSSIQTGLNPTWSDGTWAGDGVTLAVVALRGAFSAVPQVSIYQSTGNTASGTSVAKLYTSANLAGDLSLVMCEGQQSGPPTLSIADSRGNSYTQIDSVTNAVNETMTWWYAPSIAGGSNTVTCTSNVSSTALHLGIVEYKGITGSSPLDQHQARFCSPCGTGLASNAPTAITTTSAKEILVFFGDASTSPTFGASMGPPNYKIQFFDVDTSVTNDSFILADQYVTATGTYQPYSFVHSQAGFASLSASFIAAPPSNYKPSAQIY